MSSNAESSNKNSTELKKVLHLGIQSKPLLRNLFKFRTTPKKASYETPKFVLFFYETFLGVVRNLKRFRGEGFESVPR